MEPNTSTVIIGCGIIGLSTAYYLSEPGGADPSSIHLIDASDELFRCASGFAGGFLARDWFAPSAAPLGALSYTLHAHLAATHAGHATWGYTHSTGISLSQHTTTTSPSSDDECAVAGSGADWLSSGTSRAALADHNRPWEEESIGPQWLNRGSMEVISAGGTSAQIDPRRFCEWMLREVRGRGVGVRLGTNVVGVVGDEEGVLRRVRVRIGEGGEMEEVPCTHLVLTAGAWTPRVFTSLFPTSLFQLPISALGGHSLLLRNPHFNANVAISEVCHAVFATDTLGFSPEFFARAGGELYLAGLNSTTIALPNKPADVKPSGDAIGKLKECARSMMVGELEVLRESLCFRPVTSSGRPIVSRIPDEQLGGIKTRGDAEGGVYVAAGHGAWGITQGPGTGLVLAEMMMGRSTSASVEALGVPLPG